MGTDDEQGGHIRPLGNRPRGPGADSTQEHDYDAEAKLQRARVHRPDRGVPVRERELFPVRCATQLGGTGCAAM